MVFPSRPTEQFSWFSRVVGRCIGRCNRLHDLNSMLFVYCRRTGVFLFITTSLRIAQRKKQCMQTSGPCTSKRSFDMRKVLESSHRRTRGRAGEGK